MNNCQFPIPLGIVYICMVLLGIVGIPISQFLDTPPLFYSLIFNGHLLINQLYEDSKFYSRNKNYQNK